MESLKLRLGSLLLLSVLCTGVLGDQQLSAKECENLGFTGLALCSDCKTFAEYVKNQEVCMRKLVFYPEIVAFIEEEKDEFPALKVQYAYASPPKLIMLDKDGQHIESIRIDNWKREHIRQFLKEKVKPAGSSSEI